MALRPSATEMIMEHTTVCCETMVYHLHDIVGWIDSDIYLRWRGLETISFSNISVKFLLKIDDLEVAAARRWDLNHHIRPKLADAWL